MIEHDRAGANAFDFLNHRLPVLDWKLDIGDTGQFKVTGRNCFLKCSGDRLAVRDLFLNDMNTVVIGLPQAAILHVFEKNRERISIMHFRWIRLKTVAVLVWVGRHMISVIPLRYTP